MTSCLHTTRRGGVLATLSFGNPPSFRALLHLSLFLLGASMFFQVSHYTFEVEEPYSAGQSLGLAEAQVLNLARKERLRNAISKRIDKMAPQGGLLSPAQLSELAEALSSLDSTFAFSIHQIERSGRKKTGLQEYLEEVSLELARNELAGLLGEEPTRSLVAKRGRELLADPRVMVEAQARLAAKHEVTRNALAELLS